MLEEAPSNWKLETYRLPLYNDETLFLSAIYFQVRPKFDDNRLPKLPNPLVHLKIRPCRQKILTSDCEI